MKKILTALALTVVATSVQAATPVEVPSDPKASYAIVVKNINGAKAVITQRKGPSGTSFSIREINCLNNTFRYMGEGDSIKEMIANVHDRDPMSRLVRGSISYYIVKAACK